MLSAMTAIMVYVETDQGMNWQDYVEATVWYFARRRIRKVQMIRKTNGTKSWKGPFCRRNLGNAKLGVALLS